MKKAAIAARTSVIQRRMRQMRDEEEPLDEPQPARERLGRIAFQPDGIGPHTVSISLRRCLV
jgi:hypothetical protein